VEKSPVSEELKKEFGKTGTVRYDILDKHSGLANDNRQRAYHNFDSVAEDYLIIELGYGGDATKRPMVWMDKLEKQGFIFRLVRLTAPLAELKHRTAGRTGGWIPQFTEDGYKRYQSDSDVTEFAHRLGLNETTIDTSTATPQQTARDIIETLT